jgi:hypothetical protein
VVVGLLHQLNTFFQRRETNYSKLTNDVHMAELISQLTQNLSALYTNPDPAIKSAANQWLQSFQKTVSTQYLISTRG